MSESSGSSGSSTSDEAASDPPSEEELPTPAPPAKVADTGAPKPAARHVPSMPKPQAPKLKKRKEKRPREDDEFLPTIDALQGCWRHSVNALGMLRVKGNVASFSDGAKYVLTEISPGRIDMDGWQTIASKCTPEVIVWVLQEGETVSTVNWLLEEDADDNTLEGLDSRNIIQGKRRRVKVDYAALEKQIDEEQRQYEDVFSDASSSSNEGRKASKRSPETSNSRVNSTEMSPKEWSEYQGKQAKKATGLFRQWMLSTCTSRHEEILRRKGKLQTRLPVVLVGPGRRFLEQALEPYGVKVRFHLQETLLVVDTSSRQKFQERHAADWAASSERLKGLEKRRALEKRRSEAPELPTTQPAQAPASGAPVRSEVMPQATTPLEKRTAKEASPVAADAEGDRSSTPKRRRLRRVVASDDEEDKVPSPQGPQGPQGDSNSGGQTLPPAEASPRKAAPPEMSIAQVKQQLDTSPSPEEVLQALTYLESQSVDHHILVSSKIGLTVNSLRKTYAQNPDIAKRAAALVKRWREIWERYQTQKRNV